MADSNTRVLSIQSHVVSGYVGNKSSTFPLQLLGFEVDAINSVQFSNHTGYANGFKGQVLNDSQLQDLIDGLVANELDRYSHIINGYIGSKTFLLKLSDVVKHFKEKNPELIYVCDPVMGDTGPGMYVPEELLQVYKDEIIPIADIILPNQFEAELIIGSKISTEKEAIKAMKKFHEMGPQIVFFSSAEFENSDNMVALVSQQINDNLSIFKIDIPKLPAAFVGSGDLFTALSVAWLHKTNKNLSETLEKVIATMQSVLHRTLEHALKHKFQEDSKPRPFQMELKLIQSKLDIENPQNLIKATCIHS